MPESHSTKILMLHDDKSIVDHWKSGLEQFGYRIEISFNPGEALKTLEEGAPIDLVLMAFDLYNGLCKEEADVKDWKDLDIPLVCITPESEPVTVAYPDLLQNHGIMPRGFVEHNGDLSIWDATLKTAINYHKTDKNFHEAETARKSAENALKETEELHQKLFKTVPDLIIRTDTQGNILLVNERALSHYHIASKEEVVGKNILSFIVEEDKEYAITNIRLMHEQPQGLKEYRISPDGKQVLHCEINGDILRSSNDDPTGMVFVIRDISHRRQAEKQIAYEAKLRKLLVGLSTRFINAPVEELESAIHQSLSEIGNITEADRSYIFEYDFSEQTASNTYEWCKKGISPQIGQLQNIPTASFEFWVQKHIDGENLHIEDIHELPENNLKKFMRSTGITSLLTIPLWNHKKECVGFIGFDSEHETHRFGVTEQHLLEVYAQMLVNVMERRESENLIRQNLIEKNVLLAEIHHRVKNNLAVISSLLKLDAEKYKDNVAGSILTKAENRIRSMALIHEKLYQSESLSNISFDEYIKELSKHIGTYFTDGSEDIEVRYDIQPVNLDITRAIPCGIILNEIVTNGYKHAFKNAKRGIILIGLKKEDSDIILLYRDNGEGIDEAEIKKIDAGIEDSLGLQLIRGLTDQIQGQMTVEKENGTRIEIRFPYR